MRLVKFDVGNEFDVVTVSFDPRETPEMAAAKRNRLRRIATTVPTPPQGWHFSYRSSRIRSTRSRRPSASNINTTRRRNQYAHATAIMVLTPQGRISRYFYGVDFPPKDLRMGLVEASQGKIGNAVDAVLLYCYHYDPETGKYGAMVAQHSAAGGGCRPILMLGSFDLFILVADWIVSGDSRRRRAKTRYAQ